MIMHQYCSMLKLQIFLAILFGIYSTSSVQAANWDIVPGISVTQTVTDNANLNADEEFDSITRIAPRISIYGDGSRVNLDLSYRPEYRHYWHETQDDELVHYLRADGDVELWKDYLFIDGWATADRRTITSTGRTGIDGLTGTDDLADVYTAGISPYFTTRFGRSVAFEARYGLDRVYYSAVDEEIAADSQDSSTGQRVDLVLGSSPSITVTPWEVRLEQSNINYDDLEDNDQIQKAVGEIAYQLNNAWALAAVLGYEDYELAVNEDGDGQIWSVGFIYTPNTRTRLAAGAGERVFGDDRYLEFSHRSRQTVWTADYVRDLISARDEMLRPRLFQRRDAFGNLIRDPVLTDPVTSGRSSPTLGAGYYLLKDFDTTYTLNMVRTSLSLGAGYAEREYAESSLGTEPDTRDVDLTAHLTRQIRPSTSGFLSLTWIDHDEDDQTGAVELSYVQWIAALGGSYQLGARSSIGLRIAHLDRDASIDEDSYKENQASVMYDMSW